jgi:hypothetical protein
MALAPIEICEPMFESSIVSLTRMISYHNHNTKQ